MAKISIILPSYNHAKFLKDRLDTIINQTYTNWKIIIIDDCSSDNSIKILKEFREKYKDKIEEFIINKVNSGSGYKSWEKGIHLAKGEYIWIAETDDYSNVFFLEDMVKALDESKKSAFVFCTSIYVDDIKKFLYTSEKRTKELNVKENSKEVFEGGVLINRMPFNTLITNGSSVLFRNPASKLPAELFSYKQSSDIFLWTYLVNNNSFVFLNKQLNYFRRHEDSTTVKINKNSFKKVYEEKIQFLNYFKIENRSKEFINHYIKHYVWLNKKKWNDINFLKKMNSNESSSILYFKLLIQYFLLKIVKR